MRYNRIARAQTCPWCSHELGEIARAAGPVQPIGKGDHFVCVHCGGIATYDGAKLVATRWDEVPAEDMAAVFEARADLRGLPRS